MTGCPRRRGRQEAALGARWLRGICHDSHHVIAVLLLVIFQPSFNCSERTELPRVCLSHCPQFPSRGRWNKYTGRGSSGNPQILHTNINNMALFADSGFLGNGRLWAESQAAPAVEYTEGLQIMLLPKRERGGKFRV